MIFLNNKGVVELLTHLSSRDSSNELDKTLVSAPVMMLLPEKFI